jgi:hypothetical protein
MEQSFSRFGCPVPVQELGKSPDGDQQREDARRRQRDEALWAVWWAAAVGSTAERNYSSWAEHALSLKTRE